MLRYTLNRLLALVPILVFVSFVTFTLVRLTPGDPALIMVGGRKTSPEVLEAIRSKYKLNENVFSQYLYWSGQALRGNLGESFRLKQQVSDLIQARLPLTIKLVVLSTLLSLLIAIPLGVVAALHKNSWVDYLASLISLVGVSAPVFFSGIVAVLIFSYWLRLLPAFGAGDDGLLDQLRHLIMPASVLALSTLAISSRMTRSSMLEVLGSDYIEAARAKGLPGATVVIKHALRNALIPVVTVASLQMGVLLVNCVLVEYTFGLGGLGSLITDAIQNRDYPLIQGTVLFLALSFVLLNLATDLLYAAIDPRIRYGT